MGLSLSEKQREQIIEFRDWSLLRKWLLGVHCEKHHGVVMNVMVLLLLYAFQLNN